MKIKVAFLLIFVAITAVSQTKRTEDAVWWEIAEECFKNTEIKNHNTLYLGYNNDHVSGSIYKKRLNSVGRMLHPILLFDYEAVAKALPNYPTPEFKELKEQPAFKIKDSKEHQTELVAKLLKECGMHKANSEANNLLLNTVATELKFIKCGISEFDKDKFENNLQKNKKTDFAKETRNGERYLILQTIWFKDIEIAFNLSPENLQKLKDLYSANTDSFNNQGIEIRENRIAISYKKQFHPFAILGEITKIIGLKSFQGIVIEPDFDKYNNLIKYKSNK